MHCKYCDIDIDTNTKICPLCHEKLEDIDETLPKAFPDKKPRKSKHKHFTLTNIYSFVSIIVFLLCVIINYIVDSSILWCYIVGGLLAYGLVIIRNTVQSPYSIGIKVFVQTVSISLLIWLVEWITHTWQARWALNYAMPIVHMISVVVLGILVACFIRTDRNNLVSVIIFSILGIIPIILFWCGVVNRLVPALIDAIVSIVVILTAVIFGHKEIRNEFGRKFHI